MNRYTKTGKWIQVPVNYGLLKSASSVDLLRWLADAGMIIELPMMFKEDPGSLKRFYLQEETIGHLLNKKFNWPWEPQWKKNKRLLKRKFC